MEAITDAAIELVVTDLDGTLWGSDERVHERTLAALHDLEQRDVPVLVATGRRLRSAVTTLARSGLELPTVVLDGTLGRDVPAQRTFHRAPFSPEQARSVLAAFEAAGVEPCVYVERSDAEVVVGANPSTHPAHVDHIGAWLAVDDLERVVDSEEVLMFAIVAGETSAMEAVAGGVRGHGTAAITRDVVYGGRTITVRPEGLSKWDGVLAWCADQGLDAERVLAVGDGENDLELLREARVSCVVSDGCDAALDLAHHVVEPAAEGGWARILDLM